MLDRKSARAAADIWEGGACNPRGIVRALVAAVDAACENGSDGIFAEDAAPVRVILAQFCHLARVSFDGIGDCQSAHGDVMADLARCKGAADA